jgi:predicted RND superfamily exporter protein
MFVLYANMLRSLVTSQEQTLGMVAAALLLMLWMLFRSLRLALLGLVPNVLPIVLVLGLMGWLGIPLDMMTIMIASVAMGQAVDATIHYTFRWQAERRGGATADDAILLSHGSVGRAIFVTAFTVVGGFWVLVFSNFKPTIYFGIFTSVAMASAIAASLVLLPVLLRRWGEGAGAAPPR